MRTVEDTGERRTRWKHKTRTPTRSRRRRSGAGRAGYVQDRQRRDQRGVSLFEGVAQPQGGPPPRIQHGKDEWTYVLEGEFEFLDKGRPISGGPGSMVYVPKGKPPHPEERGPRSRQVTDRPDPGDHSTGFFEEAGEQAVDKGAPPVMDARPTWRRSWRPQPAAVPKYRLQVRKIAIQKGWCAPPLLF